MKSISTILIFLVTFVGFGQMTGGGSSQGNGYNKKQVSKYKHFLDRKYLKFSFGFPVGGFGDKMSGESTNSKTYELKGVSGGTAFNLQFGKLYHLNSLDMPKTLKKFDLAIDFTFANASLCFTDDFTTSVATQYYDYSTNEIQTQYKFIDDSGTFFFVDSRVGLVGNYKIRDDFSVGGRFQLSVFGFSTMAFDEAFGGDTYTAIDYLRPYFGFYTIYKRMLFDMGWEVGDVEYAGEVETQFGSSDVDIIVPFSKFSLTFGILL